MASHSVFHLRSRGSGPTCVGAFGRHSPGVSRLSRSFSLMRLNSFSSKVILIADLRLPVTILLSFDQGSGVTIAITKTSLLYLRARAPFWLFSSTPVRRFPRSYFQLSLCFNDLMWFQSRFYEAALAGHIYHSLREQPCPQFLASSPYWASVSLSLSCQFVIEFSKGNDWIWDFLLDLWMVSQALGTFLRLILPVFQ